MQQYLILEKQKDSGSQSQVDKQKTSIKKTQKLKPADGAGRSKSSANLPMEQQKSSSDAPEQPDDFYREEIQDLLAEALETEFPDLELNEIELAELTDTVITIRDSMETIRMMERTAENVEVLEETRERRDQAMLDFERITGMNALEFMLRAPSEGGIDHD